MGCDEMIEQCLVRGREDGDDEEWRMLLLETRVGVRCNRCVGRKKGIYLDDLSASSEDCSSVFSVDSGIPW